MKPIKLEMQAFGPFDGYEAVNFDDFTDSKIFLICGETGSGKSTILDGMMMALYGTTSWSVLEKSGKSDKGKGKLETLRCTKAEFGTSTFVRFTFEEGGKEYRFERRLDRKTKNLSEKYEAGVKNSEGIFEPLFENPKANELTKYAEELIGFTADQFRQVVILPQGQFERLLVSETSEKEKILSQVFHTERWKRYAEELFVEAKSRLDTANDERKNINTVLQTQGCESLDELAEKIEDDKQGIVDLESKIKELDYDRQMDEIQKAFRIIEKFEELDELKEKLSDLVGKSSEYDKKQETLNLANRAENLRTFIEKTQDFHEKWKYRDTAVRTAEDAKEQAKKERDKAIQEYNTLEEKKDSFEALKKKSTTYENKKGTYQSIDSYRNDYNEKQTEEEKKKKELDNENDAVERLSKRVNRAFSAWNGATEKRSQGAYLYNLGICGEIASELKPGVPCPVCGSTEHPHIAERNNDAISKAQLEELQKVEKEKEESWKKLDDALGKEKESLEKKQREYQGAQVATAGAKTKYEQAQEELIDGIESLYDLKLAIDTMESSIQRYTTDLESANEDKQEKEKEYTTADANLSTALKELQTAEDNYKKSHEALLQSLNEYNFESEQEAEEALLSQQNREALLTEITEYNQKIEGLKKDIRDKSSELEDVEKPDKDAVEERRKRIGDKKSEYESKNGALRKTLKDHENTFSDLKDRQQEYDRTRQQIDEDYELARKIRGDSGIGLQRYVIGAMLSSVITAANKMLEKVHNGRYRLYRSDEKGIGNKSGLELYVHDSMALDGESGRSVRTMSGGEKFLVSLALSIGLASVAQSTGMHLDAMFIDEGFGTLDAESIDDALEVLKMANTNKGIIGIISHVDVLRANIAAKLEVKKGDENHGSHITTLIG